VNGIAVCPVGGVAHGLKGEQSLQDRSALLEQQVDSLQDQLVATQNKCAALEEELRRTEALQSDRPEQTWTPGHANVTVTELHTTCQVSSHSR
jgi:phage shock protein A